jgi:hypothetical protein
MALICKVLHQQKDTRSLDLEVGCDSAYLLAIPQRELEQLTYHLFNRARDHPVYYPRDVIAMASTSELCVEVAEQLVCTTMAFSDRNLLELKGSIYDYDYGRACELHEWNEGDSMKRP